MKKILLVVLIFLLVILIAIGCADEDRSPAEGWYTVQIDEVGSFNVPDGWIVTQEKNTVYFTDKPITEDDYNIYMIGAIWDDDDSSTWIAPEILLDDKVHYLEHDVIEAFSTSVNYGVSTYETPDGIGTRYTLNIYGGHSILLTISPDTTVDEEIVKTIAKSYSNSSIYTD